jgi:dipeptide/tripeptide permease
MSIEKRQKAIWVALGLAVLAALGAGVLASQLIQKGPGHLPLSLVIVACAVLIAAVVLATVPWWRKLDDMARDAHLTSWYWGASFGGGVALLAAAAIDGQGPLFQGAILVFGAQALAYILCWLGWWALRRPRAS